MKEESSFGVVANYFLIQELLGFLFLLLFTFGSPLLVLFLKVGVSPFHFWVVLVSFYLEGFLLSWFLTFQKLPFVPLFFFFMESGYFLIFFGILLCFFNIFFYYDSKALLVLGTTESFCWLLFVSFFSFSFFIFVFFYYFFSFSFFFFSFLCEPGDPTLLEFGLLFINIPLGVSFFTKLLVFRTLRGVSFFFFFFLLLLFLFRVLGLSRLLFLTRMSTHIIEKKGYGPWFFLLFPISLLVLF